MENATLNTVLALVQASRHCPIPGVTSIASEYTCYP